ncbi:MAG: dethiobiotin synthase [Spirochaetales bacterium]|nr:dethiobiotin synthase [Spirochaetales bacterium]
MSFFLCGTGTGVGKTITAAAIMQRFARKAGLCYFKPIQTGTENGDDDCRTVRELSGLPADFFKATLFAFKAALSPHRAAELEGEVISFSLLMDAVRAPGLLIEGAGGLLVPINRQFTWLDLLRESQLPVILSAQSGLGTINHSLLTLRTLKGEGLRVLAVVFCGELNPDNMRTVTDFSGVPAVAFDGGSIPDLSRLDPQRLLEDFIYGN